MRLTVQPGWRWSECVTPIARTDSCQVRHVLYTISGHMRVHMYDGTNTDIGPAGVSVIPRSEARGRVEQGSRRGVSDDVGASRT
jgi:hypothetical protein